MNGEMILVLALLGAALVAFAFEWLGVDVITLLVVATLVLSGILTTGEAFAGFASEIIVILGSIFILSGALIRTGVMEWLGTALFRAVGHSEISAQLTMMALSGTLSAFVNNTNATAVLMPAATELGRRSGVAASRLLMPLAYASILGGTCTMIGTSTNVAASGMLARLGQEPLGLFELSPVGVVIAVCGIVWMGTVGYRLLPVRETTSLGQKYLSTYLSVVVVPQGSPLVGKSLEQIDLGRRELNVLNLVRGDERLYPSAGTELRAGDELIVHGPREALVRLRESGEWRFEGEGAIADAELSSDSVTLAEAIVMPSSSLAGSTLTDLRFRHQYGVAVLGIYRRGYGVATHIRDLALRSGDVLLVQAAPARLAALQDARDVLLLGEVAHVPFRRRRGAIAVAALLGAIVFGGLQLVPLSIAMLLGALVVVVARCVRPTEVYQLIDWRLLVLIGGMTSLGLAMQKTGAAEEISGRLVEWLLPFGPHAVLGGLAVLTMVLTQPLSNAAAVLVVLPIALSTAAQLDANPRTFAITVTLAASLSFITPFEPASLLVYGPGGYRFADFVRSGAVLSVISLALLLLLVPRFWPL